MGGLTNGQRAAIIRGICLAIIIAMPILVLASMPPPMARQVHPWLWVLVGVAVTLLITVAFYLVSLDWRGKTVIACRSCGHGYNINAHSCPFCGPR